MYGDLGVFDMPDKKNLEYYLELFNTAGQLKSIPKNDTETLSTIGVLLTANLNGLVAAAYIDFLQKNHPHLITDTLKEQVKTLPGASKLPINHPIFNHPSPLYGYVGKTTTSVYSKEVVKKGLIEATVQTDDLNARRAFIKLSLEQEHNTSTQLLDIADLNNYIQNLAPNKDGRYQLIIDNNGHFSAVDINISQGKKQCIILDAANDPRMNDIQLIFQLNQFDRIHQPLGKYDELMGKPLILQYDKTSCPIFAIEHTKQMALLPDLYSWMESIIEQEEGEEVTYLTRLPPELIRDAQSIFFLAYYQGNHHELLKNPMQNGQLLQDYIRTHTIHTATGKEQNRSIDHRKQSMIQQIRQTDATFHAARQELVRVKADVETLKGFDVESGALIRPMAQIVNDMQQKRDSVVEQRFNAIQQKLRALSFGQEDLHLQNFLKKNEQDFLGYQRTNIFAANELVNALEQKHEQLQQGIHQRAKQYILQKREEKSWYTVGKEKAAQQVEHEMRQLSIEDRLALASESETVIATAYSTEGER